MNRTQIVQLNSALRDVIEFRRYEEEGSNWMAPAAAGAAGTAALGAGALYARGKFMQGPVRSGARGVADTMGQGIDGLKGDIGALRDKFNASKFGTSYNTGYQRAGGGLKGFFRGLRGGARMITAGRSRFVGLSSASPITELNAALSEVIEFRSADDLKKNEKGQSPSNNMRRGVGIGVLSGGIPGILVGGRGAEKFREEGLVYKKRDALGHAGGGYLAGGIPGSIAGVLPGAGMMLSKNPKIKMAGAVAAQLGSLAGGIGGTMYAGNRFADATLEKRKRELGK